MSSAGSIPSTAPRELLAPLLLSIAVAAVTPTLTTDWTDDDLETYLDFADQIQSPYDVPIRVAAHESDNRTTAWNHGGNASGLWQMMPATLKGLGYDLASDPMLVAFRALSVTEQLKWWTLYYKSKAGNLGTVGELYLADFIPAADHDGNGRNPGYVVCGTRPGDPYCEDYHWNWIAFDVKRDANGRALSDAGGHPIPDKGYITVQDLIDATVRATGPRTRELIARVQAAKAVRDTAPG